MKALGTLVVVGVGLIGGSFALDLRRAGLVGEVVGLGRSAQNLQRALQLGVIDRAETDPAQALAGADLLLLATPVGQMGGVLAKLRPHLSDNTLISDVGSTKRDVTALFQQYLPDSLSRCVPAHPIAGSDLSGAQAARYGLFAGRKVVLCPMPQTSSEACARLAALWQACGASTPQLSAAEHDEVFAAVSHLPHLLAFAYMNSLLDRPDAQRCLSLAASGFRDFTRIAAASPEMWRDITVANRDSLLRDLQAYMSELQRWQALLEAGDEEGLLHGLNRASAARGAWGRPDRLSES